MEAIKTYDNSQRCSGRRDKEFINLVFNNSVTDLEINGHNLLDLAN